MDHRLRSDGVPANNDALAPAAISRPATSLASGSSPLRARAVPTDASAALYSPQRPGLASSSSSRMPQPSPGFFGSRGRAIFPTTVSRNYLYRDSSPTAPPLAASDDVSIAAPQQLTRPSGIDLLLNDDVSMSNVNESNVQAAHGDGITQIYNNINHNDEDDEANRRVIWGTNINVQDSSAMFSDFLRSYCPIHSIRYTRAKELNIDVADLLDADYVVNGPDDELPYYLRHFEIMKDAQVLAMNLDCAHLLAYPPAARLYEQLIKYPHEIITLMDIASTNVFVEHTCHTHEERQAFDNGRQSLSVRPFNLRDSLTLRDLNPWDIDRLVSVKGLLIRTSPVIPDPKGGFFRCLVCEYCVEVPIDRGRIAEPTRCANPACARLHTMQLVHNRSRFTSKQLCKLQETPDSIPEGYTPYTVPLNVYDDLVDSSKPGDRVCVTGIFRSMPVRISPRVRAFKPVFRTFLDVVHVRTIDPSRIAKDPSAVEENEFIPISATLPATNHNLDLNANQDIGAADFVISPEDEHEILRIAGRPDLYDYLARSIAPSIFEMDDAKKGVLLQLFGGLQKRAGNARYRGDINILLVGDPGVAKSQLLQYVHKIAPRGIYTSGKGSSAVGLTASVARDPDTRALVLESGALVLSDGGVCCIDEFDKMSDLTRAVLHEVMEQQTISIAKAGIITTLNARTSILASANPVNSKFDHRLSLVDNIALPPSLLSRFDLLFVILDVPSEDYDRRLAKHLVSLYMTDYDSNEKQDDEEHKGKHKVAAMDFCEPKVLSRYISYARARVHPVLTDAATAALTREYVEMRSLGRDSNSSSSGGGNSNSNNSGSTLAKTVTATTRQLESMIRLSEASARMRLSPTVEASDVAEAARLIREALKQGATDPVTGRIDIDLLAGAGVSKTKLRARAALAAALRSVLLTRESPRAAINVAYAELRAALGHGDGEGSVPREDFDAALADCEAEGIVRVDRRTTLIRRLVDRVVVPSGASASASASASGRAAAVAVAMDVNMGDGDGDE